jgi:ribosomal protein S12 methylthiotransferase
MEHRYYIEHLGCAKNRVDAEGMARTLRRAGWVECADAESARLIIVNSCGFIEAAKTESIETTLLFRKRYPDKKILLAGCLSERYGTELSESMSEIDGVFGNRELSRVAEVAGAIMGDPPGLRAADAMLDTDDESEAVLVGGGTGYLKIAEGCDNRCSYCAIPLIRGALRSRPACDILADAETLLGMGAKEIALIAQDIASWGTDFATPGDRLTTLIRRMLRVPEEFWLRLLYIHPDHFPEELLEIVAADPRVLPYFDLPFQHASVPILRAMGRSGSPTAYLSLIDTIRASLPDAVIRSTFLVGFPGEDDADRKALLDFQRHAEIDWLGVFEYSSEEGTRARSLGVPGAAERRRAKRFREELESRQTPITWRRLDRFVGRDLPVLIEEPFVDSDLAIGRAYLNAPEVDGNVVVHGDRLAEGALVRCRIFKRNGFDLEAEVVD